MPRRSELHERRSRLLRAWDRYFGTDRTQRGDDESGGGENTPSGLRTEIVASWERSADHLPSTVDAAPMADPDDTRTTWEESPLRAAVERLEPDLRLAAEDGDLVVALTDPWARILWTYGGACWARSAHALPRVTSETRAHDREEQSALDHLAEPHRRWPDPVLRLSPASKIAAIRAMKDR